MDIAPPSPESFAALTSKHFHRYPEKFTVTVLGDGGLPVKIPIVLGNPSGACELPPGDKPSPAWSQSVGIALGFLRDAQDVGQALARDCVLHPDPETIDELFDRWPGLPDRLLIELRKKIGGSSSQVIEPSYDERPQGPIADALAADPRRTWRRIVPLGAVVDLVIEPPTQVVWQLFVDEMKRKEAAYGDLARKMAQASIKLAVISTGTITVEHVLYRWPGSALLVIQVLTQLIGLEAEVVAGGW